MANELAYYIRLSEADEETGKIKDESESISNQRALILKYISDQPEFEAGPSGSTLTMDSAVPTAIVLRSSGCWSVSMRAASNVLSSKIYPGSPGTIFCWVNTWNRYFPYWEFALLPSTTGMTVKPQPVQQTA